MTDRSGGGEVVLRPWALSRLEPPSLPLGMTAIRVEVNPETQTGIYYGPGGQVLQMGKHGTSRTKGTPHTTNQDGKELDDGVLTDYESD